MIVEVKIGEEKFSCDLLKGHDISIPLKSGSGVIAWGAAAYKSTPFKDGDFVGALETGSPVNFYDLFINPHGNGTHTETVRHIDQRGYSIYDALKRSHFISKLLTITPITLDNGDLIISENKFDEVGQLDNVEALVIRTRPNTIEKLEKNYTGTNPCYIDPGFIEKLNKTNVKHLLIDLPSVDREVDGGKMLSHKTYWEVDNGIAFDKTITEMIYVDNAIEDGLYLLNLQTISVDIDASPSKPILYALKKL